MKEEMMINGSDWKQRQKSTQLWASDFCQRDKKKMLTGENSASSTNSDSNLDGYK